MQRTEQKTAYFVKCDFCRYEKEIGSPDRNPMIRFSMSSEFINGCATMDICEDCQDTMTFDDLLRVHREAFEAMQPKQPHNSDVEEWRR